MKYIIVSILSDEGLMGKCPLPFHIEEANDDPVDRMVELAIAQVCPWELSQDKANFIKSDRWNALNDRVRKKLAKRHDYVVGHGDQGQFSVALVECAD